jgi:hypothetical protein
MDFARLSFARRLLSLVALLSTMTAGAALAAPANFESRSLTTPAQADGRPWHAVTFMRTFATRPVVIMGPATGNEADPFVVRVRNVTTTGFEYQIDEWDYSGNNGRHNAPETVHFFALTEGTHVFGSQRWQVGRLAAVNRTPVAVALNAFASSPVVLGQVETTVNQANGGGGRRGVKALKARVSDVGSGSFQVRLQTQQSDTGAISNEGVSYIAVSEGTGYLDGKELSAVRAPSAVTHSFATFSFPAARTNPIFVGQAQSFNDADPGELKMTALSATSVQLRYQEETSANADVTHAAEDLGYLVLGDMPGELAAKIGLGDVQVTQANALSWTTVNLSQSYTSPVVVMGPLSSTDSTPLTVRVRNVTSNSFEFQVDRWDHAATAAHSAPELLGYLVMESGTYAVGGTVWQAGGTSSVTQTASSQPLDPKFTAPPAVLSQVVSANDTDAVQSRVSAVTAASFAVELDESEIDPTPHSGETVHWIAITQGTSNFFSLAMRLQAGSTGGVGSAWVPVNLSRMHADPFLFAALQTKNDTDPATLRWRNLFADRVDLVAQEDEHPAQFGEGVVDNAHSPETVAFLVVQGAVDVDEDGAPDAWELSVGLNPNDPADGAADPDGDLLTNQQEYHNRLDFVSSSNPFGFTGGIVSVKVLSPAYEVNDRSATPVTSSKATVAVSRKGGIAPLTVNFSTTGTDPLDTDRAPANGADFSITDSADNPLTNSVSIPANADGATFLVVPVQDSADEYPEGLRVALQSNGSAYTIGAPSNDVVMIYDAQDIPANERLFVGSFLAQGSAVTSASGFATAILNGLNNRVRISTTFNGLTTPQTEIDGSHVHYFTSGGGIIASGTILYGEPDGLPTGPLIDYPWDIVDSAGLKGQQIIDALFRKNTGENLYINVHTNRYASGEIRADLTLQTGSAGFTPPPAAPGLEDLATDDEVKRDCARFLTQATFGPSEAEIQALFDSIPLPKTSAANRIAAFTSWLNSQWSLTQTSLYDYTYAADQQEWSLWGQQPALPEVVDNPATTTINETYPAAPPPNNALDWTRWGVVPSPAGAWTYRPVPPGLNKESYDPDYFNRRRGWWTIVNRAQDQVRQRVAEALEQTFVISDRDGTIQGRAYAHARYYDMLGDAADGVRDLTPPNGQYSTPAGGALRYRELLKDISKSPMMGRYLSHLKNSKQTVNAQGQVVTQPDENYAREIMQLFSIGLLQMHPDGTLKLGGGGQPMATYDNEDIKTLARVFTGWSFAWVQNSAANGYVPSLVQNTFLGSEGLEYFHPGYENPMRVFVASHDEAAKAPPSLGFTRPAYTGLSTDTAARTAYAEADLDATIDALSNHDNVGPFLARRLIQRLVTSNPSRGYVYRVSQQFANDGSGVRGNLKAVVNAILLDYEARSLTNVDPQTINGNTSVNVGFGKVKEPMVRYVQLLRAFGASSQLNAADLSSFGYPAAQLANLGANATRFRYPSTLGVLGQAPHNMPSVFNWYLPDYTPGGRVSAAGLVAPELQIITENLVVQATNYHRTIDYGSVIDPVAALPTGQGVDNILGDTTTNRILDNVFINLAPLVASYKANRDTTGATNVSAATYLVDRLDALLCSGSLKAKYPYAVGGTNPRSVIIDQVAQISPTNTNPLPIANAGARVRAAVYLMACTPEFVVQK